MPRELTSLHFAVSCFPESKIERGGWRKWRREKRGPLIRLPSIQTQNPEALLCPDMWPRRPASLVCTPRLSPTLAPLWMWPRRTSTKDVWVGGEWGPAVDLSSPLSNCNSDWTQRTPLLPYPLEVTVGSWLSQLSTTACPGASVSLGHPATSSVPHYTVLTLNSLQLKPWSVPAVSCQDPDGYSKGEKHRNT